MAELEKKLADSTAYFAKINALEQKVSAVDQALEQLREVAPDARLGAVGGRELRDGLVDAHGLCPLVRAAHHVRDRVEGAPLHLLELGLKVSVS